MHCRAHALQLQRDRDRFDAAGAELAVVGMGTPAHALHFRDEMGIDLRLLLSHDKEAYRAFDLPRGRLDQVFDPRAAFKALPRTLRGRGQSARLPQQDWQQLGGAFVIAPDGEIVWAHRAAHSGDNPSHDEMLAAVADAR